MTFESKEDKNKDKKVIRKRSSEKVMPTTLKDKEI
jgi:hypothetical protein